VLSQRVGGFRLDAGQDDAEPRQVVGMREAQPAELVGIQSTIPLLVIAPWLKASLLSRPKATTLVR
jgi:hypothetical protein